MYSSILLSMCPFPKLARAFEFHLTLILWQLQNYDGNKYMYYEKNKVVISDDSNSLSLINNKMPLYILMLKSSIIRCRKPISQRAKPGRLSEAHSDQLFSADSNFDEFQPKLCILMLYSVLYLSLFLFRVQDFTGYLYIWKISKFIFLDKKMCMRSYFNKLMPPLSNQMYNFLLPFLISCFQCASIMQVNIKSWTLSNYLWICLMLILFNQSTSWIWFSVAYYNSLQELIYLHLPNKYYFFSFKIISYIIWPT